MTQKLGTIGVLDILLGGDAALFRKATGDAEKSLGKLEGKMADSAKAAALFSAAAAAAAGSVFMMVSRVSESIDEVGKLSQKIGVGVEALSALRHAASIANVSNEELTTGLRQLNKNMLDMRNNTGEAKDAFRELGVDVVAANGKLKPTEEMLLELSDKFKGLQDETLKSALAQRIFGRSGAQLLPLLNEGSAGIKALMEEAKRLGLVITQDMADAAEQFNDNMTRMKGAVEGLTMKIAGPMIEAFAKATESMVKANKAGEDFFSTIIEGFRTLVTGDDLHKWNVEMASLGSRLHELKNKRDQLATGDTKGFGLMGESKEQTIKRATSEINAAIQFLEAKIKSHLAIKPILAPDAPDKKKTEGEEGSNFQTEAAKKEIEKRESEIRSIIQAEGAKRDALELAQIEKRNQQQAEAQARFLQQQQELQQYFADQEIAQGQAIIERRRLLKDFEFKSEEELEMERHQGRLNQLSVFTEEELAMIGGKQAAIERLENEHQLRMLDIRGRGLDSLAAFNKASWERQTAHVVGELASMTAGVANSSKTMFKINKAAGIANAIVNTAQGVTKALATYPPPLSFAMAAAQLAAGVAQIQTIRSAQFGGGGGAAPSIRGSTPADPVSPVGGSGGGSQGPGRTVIVNLGAGEIFSRSTVRGLMKRMSEETRDGGRVEFVG